MRDPNPHSAQIEEARRRRARLFDPVTGKLHVHIAGAAPDDDGSTPPPAPTPPAQPTTPPAGTTGPSQAEIDRQIAAARAEAERTTREQYDTYLADEARKRDQASLSEAERREAQAQEREAAAEARENAAAEREHAADVRDALRDAGVPRDSIERVRLMVTVKPGASTDEIKADVDKLKADVPGVFGVAEAGDGKGPTVDPKTKPAGGQNPTAMDRGREKARAEREAQQSTNPLDTLRVVGATPR